MHNYPPFARKVLEEIRKGRFKKQIAGDLGCVPSKVHYWCRIFEQEGIISRAFKSRYVQYRLSLGLNSKLLVCDEKGLPVARIGGETIGLENVSFKCRILSDAVIPNLRLIKLHNNEQFLGEFQNTTVRKTTKNLIFEFRKLISDARVRDRARGFALFLRDEIERETGIRLGDPELSKKGEFIPLGLGEPPARGARVVRAVAAESPPGSSEGVVEPRGASVGGVAGASGARGGTVGARAPRARGGPRGPQAPFGLLPLMDLRTIWGKVDDSDKSGNKGEWYDVRHAMAWLEAPERLDAQQSAIDAQGARVAELSKQFDRQLDLNFQVQNGMEKLLQNIELLNKTTVEMLGLLKELRK